MISCPCNALRLPFLEVLKHQNSEGFISKLRVSKNAFMIHAKRFGDALSPCCTPVLYLMFMASGSSLQLTEPFFYIFSTALTREFRTLYLLGISNRSECCMVSNVLTRSTKSA